MYDGTYQEERERDRNRGRNRERVIELERAIETETLLLLLLPSSASSYSLLGVVLIRGTGVVPFTAERVRSAICTPAARKFWEESVFEVKVTK